VQQRQLVRGVARGQRLEQPAVAAAEVDRAQVRPDADRLAGQRPPHPHLPTDQLQVPAGRRQHLQLHRPPITHRRRWVGIAGHHQPGLAWAAPAGTEPRCRDRHRQRLVGPLMVVALHPTIHRLLRLLQVANGPSGSSSSRRSVWWNRSTFPVVVGERTLVRRWVIPLSRKIRSNSTSTCRGLA
jgi:hypothetical protein